MEPDNLAAVVSQLTVNINNMNSVMGQYQELQQQQNLNTATALQQLASVVQHQAHHAEAQHQSKNTVAKALASAKLPDLDGVGKAKDDLDTWLFLCEQNFQTLSSATDTEKIMIAALRLKGHSASWWRDVTQLPQSQRPSSWGEFKRQIMQVYMPITREEVARDKLATAKQVSTLEQYIGYIRKLFYAIPNITEEEKLDRFKRGLKPHLQREVLVARPKPTTLEDMIALAALHDSLQRSSHSYNRQVPQYPRLPYKAPTVSNGYAPMELDAIQTGVQTTRSSRSASASMAPQSHPLSSHNLQGHKRKRCYYCGKFGHISRHCPNKRTTTHTDQGKGRAWHHHRNQ